MTMSSDPNDAPGKWLTDREVPVVRLCPTRTPEPHWLGEFPMTCYRCHLEADS